MAKKSKLLSALDAHKGRDYEAEKSKKQLKAGEKRKREREGKKQQDVEDEVQPVAATKSSTSKSSKKPNGILKTSKSTTAVKPPKDEEEEWESEPEEENDDLQAEIAGIEEDTTIPQPLDPVDASASEAEQESDVPLSDLDAEDLEDTIPHQRLTINNTTALTASTKRVAVAKPSMPFHYHNSVISTLPPSSTTIPDPNDDLTRELEFYRIAKDGTLAARSLLKKEKLPFSRPADYFAEMVKTDEHMGKVKKKMYDEAAGKKASEEAKKLRDARKFGKAVQMAKEQDRAREKRDTLDKIKELKRKRKGQPSTSTTEAADSDLFQEIAVDNTTNTTSSSNRGRDRDRSNGQPNAKRQKRDSKFGFGGKKRFSKSGDAVSSGDLSGFSTGRMKGRSGGGGGRGGGAAGGKPGRAKMTTRRLGKSKRVAVAGRV